MKAGGEEEEEERQKRSIQKLGAGGESWRREETGVPYDVFACLFRLYCLDIPSKGFQVSSYPRFLHREIHCKSSGE